jgi:hypothetical protein
MGVRAPLCVASPGPRAFGSRRSCPVGSGGVCPLSRRSAPRGPRRPPRPSCRDARCTCTRTDGACGRLGVGFQRVRFGPLSGRTHAPAGVSSGRPGQDLHRRTRSPKRSERRHENPLPSVIHQAPLSRRHVTPVPDLMSPPCQTAPRIPWQQAVATRAGLDCSFSYQAPVATAHRRATCRRRGQRGELIVPMKAGRTLCKETHGVRVRRKGTPGHCGWQVARQQGHAQVKHV